MANRALKFRPKDIAPGLAPKSRSLRWKINFIGLAAAAARAPGSNLKDHGSTNDGFEYDDFDGSEKEESWWGMKART
ncbi:hypothetical protein RU639_013090 [Aspergillus parasiticus]